MQKADPSIMWEYYLLRRRIIFFYVVFQLLLLGSAENMLLMLVTASEQSRRVWMPEDDLTEPSSWSPPKLPCAQDVVVFPETLPYGVRARESNLRIREVRLPQDGSIMFKDITFDDSPATEDCPGEEVHFVMNLPHGWSNHRNWVTDVNDDNFNYLFGMKAQPDIYGIPCMMDDVVVNTSEVPIGRMPIGLQYVRSITVDGRPFTNKEWQTVEGPFENTYDELGNLHQGPAVVILDEDYYERYGQPDELPCQERPPREMCRYRVCEATKCLNPIIPKNHCCGICGVEMTVGTMESIVHTRLAILKALDNDTDGIAIWVGVLSRKYLQGYIPTLYTMEWLNSEKPIYQIVIVDAEEYNQLSTAAGRKILNKLKYDFNLTKGHEVLMSGLPWEGPDVAPGGWEALIMLFVVLSVLLIILLYHYPPNSINTSRLNYRTFTFARFENRSREGSLVQGISQLSLNKEFDNPMYTSRLAEEDKETIAEDISENSEDTGIELTASVSESKSIKHQETALVKPTMSALLKKDESY